jgi:hypothetical protein
MAILFCSGLLGPTGWAAQPSEDMAFLSRAEKPSEDITGSLFSDEYERVKSSQFVYKEWSRMQEANMKFFAKL